MQFGAQKITSDTHRDTNGAASGAAPGTILIVDDDPEVGAAMRRTLRRAGYHAATASDAGEALDALDKGRIDLVVSDELMPLLRGHALLQLMADLYPEVGRILMSGQLEGESRAEAIRRARVSSFLSKPCPPDRLLAAVEAARAVGKPDGEPRTDRNLRAANDAGAQISPEGAA